MTPKPTVATAIRDVRHIPLKQLAAETPDDELRCMASAPNAKRVEVARFNSAV